MLYGETHDFPDVLHCERIHDRAKGLDWKISPHRHGQLHQIFFIYKGYVKFSLDSQSFEFSQPTLLNVPAFHVHGFHFSPDTQGYVLSCPTSEIETLSGHEQDICSVIQTAVNIEPVPIVHTVFDQIYSEFQHETTARTPMLRSLLLNLLCLIARHTVVKARVSDKTGLFHRFERLLIAQPERALNITQIARELGTSRAGLHRTCHAATGQSAQRIAMQIKMQEAKRRLAYTQEPASQIAYRLGFEDPSYFSKVFRTHAGVSPNQYRRRYVSA